MGTPRNDFPSGTVTTTDNDEERDPIRAARARCHRYNLMAYKLREPEVEALNLNAAQRAADREFAMRQGRK